MTIDETASLYVPKQGFQDEIRNAMEELRARGIDYELGINQRDEVVIAANSGAQYFPFEYFISRWDNSVFSRGNLYRQRWQIRAACMDHYWRTFGARAKPQGWTPKKGRERMSKRRREINAHAPLRA